MKPWLCILLCVFVVYDSCMCMCNNLYFPDPIHRMLINYYSRSSQTGAPGRLSKSAPVWELPRFASGLYMEENQSICKVMVR